MATGSLSEILALMPHTLTLETWTGTRDQYGEKSYNTPTTVKAMWQAAHRIVRNQDGDETISNNQAWIYAPLQVVTVEDRVTLPDSSQPPLQAVDGFFDELGVRVAQVLFF